VGYIGKVPADVLIDPMVDSAAITDATIVTADIADNAVTSAKLAANSVDSSELIDGSIDNGHLAGSIAINKTLLAGGTGLTLSTNTLNVDAAQTQITSVGTLGSLTVSGETTFSGFLNDAKIYNHLKFVGSDGTTVHGGVRGASNSVEIRTGASTTVACTFDGSQNATFAGVILGVNGSASAPSFSFSSDTNTGIYRSGADTLAITSGGNRQVRFLDGDTYFDSRIYSHVGSAGNPSYCFNDDTNTGMYKEGADSIGFARGGEKTFVIGENQAGVYSGEGDHAKFVMYADEGDDDNDKYRIEAQHTGGGMEFQTATSGSWASMLVLGTSGASTFKGSITSEHATTPEIMLNDTGATTNRRIFRISGGGDIIHFEGRNNDNSGDGAVPSIASMSMAYGGLCVKGAFRDTVDNNPNQYQLSFGGDDAYNPRWGFRVGTSSEDEDLFLDGNLTSGSRYNALRIDKVNGWVGIGLTTTLGHKLQVESNANTFVQKIQNTHGTAPYGIAIAHDADTDNNSHKFLNCEGAGNNRCIIYTDGDVNNSDNGYGSISDVRIKQGIRDANSQWDDIKAIKVRNFKKNEDVLKYKDKAWEQIGVIAQELESSGMDKLVRDRLADEFDIANNEDINEGDKVKSVQYSIIYMKAIKALQEAMAKIETLESKVTALESA
jgi:hypothetical protein